MQRRAFLAAGTAALAASRARGSFATVPLAQDALPRLGPDVFRARRERAQAELARRGIDLVIATPGVNFHYLAGGTPGRSERLIALLLPRAGDAVIVAPSFEVARVRRTCTVDDVRGWEESEDPYALVARSVQGAGGLGLGARGAGGRVALEPTTDYQTALRLGQALRGWQLENGGPVFERLRIVKSAEELACIRAAIGITLAAIDATFAQLAQGATDREIAELVSREMSRRGATGEGLVQFGPTSALPHGGTEGRRLERETPVLIDVGCRVAGYTSDITRTRWFGDAPTARFVQVYNTVHDAQTAAMTLGRPGVACQDMDRAARRVIREAGFGAFFTHRLGHGMGMDGHEPPYEVEGNTAPLEVGNVVTIEPGIYLPDEWGARIEDDVVITAGGLEVLSRRTVKL